MCATCGPTLPEPSAFYDHDGCCWRTSQGTFPWDSTPSSVTLPRWGTTVAGVLYALPTPALPTVGQGSSSLLPTPVVNDMGAGKTVTEWTEWTERMRGAHGNGNGHGPSLSIEVQRLLPTPVARDHKGANQRQDTTCLHGALMNQPSDGGNTSSDALPHDQLSWDATDHD